MCDVCCLLFVMYCLSRGLCCVSVVLFDVCYGLFVVWRCALFVGELCVVRRVLLCVCCVMFVV